MVRRGPGGRQRARRVLQRGGHGDADATHTVQRAVHHVAVHVRPAVPVPGQAARDRATGHGRGAQGPRRTGAGHALQPEFLRVLPQTVLAAVAQLPGHIPAERDVPVHGAAEGGAQVQARDGCVEPAAGRRGRRRNAVVLGQGERSGRQQQ